MAKFIYLGDPSKNEDGTRAGPNQGRMVSYTEPSTGIVTKFPHGEAVEAPEWLAARLAKSTHFKKASEPAK